MSIFVSFQYIGTGGIKLYEGFDNAVVDDIYHPYMEEDVEELENYLRDKTLKKNGFDACVITVLHWKKL